MKLSSFPYRGNDTGEHLCTSCKQIPFDKLFDPRQFDNTQQPVSFHPVNYIEASENPCSLCKFLLTQRCRLQLDTWTWEGPEKPEYFLCTFCPPRGMLSPLPEIVCTVVGIEKGNKNEEGDFHHWCSSDWFPWPTRVFAELCLSGSVLEVKRHSAQGRGPSRYRGKDIQELRQLISKSSLMSKDERTDKRLCDITPGFRVIDCFTRRVVSLRSRDLYATLSYVWGFAVPEKRDDPFVLPVKTPPVIEDAISLTKLLGLRYIWVDQYCIPQDDPQAKLGQINRMGDIYANSCLTIVAAAGDGPEFGLPGISRPSVFPAPQDKFRVGPFSLTNVRAMSPVKIIMPQTTIDVEGEIMRSKWNTRGWTYQEAILAKRRLVFTQSWVYFQDARSERSKAWVFRQGFIKPLFQNPQLVPGICTNNIDALMREHSRNYMLRDLTYDSDVYNAFRGIQAKLQEEFAPKSFVYGLLVDKPGTTPRGYIGAKARPPINALFWVITGSPGSVSRLPAAPSWTWLGWKLARDGDAWGPAWQGPDAGITSEVGMELVYRDGFVTKWSNESPPPPERLLGEEIPQLLLRGWTFDLSVLVDKHTGPADTKSGAEGSGVVAGLSYVGAPDISSLLAPGLHALGESCFNTALESGRLLCLVLGWVVHYESRPLRRFSRLYVMVIFLDENKHTCQRVGVLQALLNQAWDGSYKEDLGWVKREVVIR